MALFPWKLSLPSQLQPPSDLVRHAGKGLGCPGCALFNLIHKQLLYLDFRVTIFNVGMTFLPLTLEKECGRLLSHGFECTLACGGQKTTPAAIHEAVHQPFKTGLSVAQSSSRRPGWD